MRKEKYFLRIHKSVYIKVLKDEFSCPRRHTSSGEGAGSHSQSFINWRQVQLTPVERVILACGDESLAEQTLAPYYLSRHNPRAEPIDRVAALNRMFR